VHVILVDYSYRSGHTFTTITRIIDFATVGYYAEENGRTIVRYRKAYSAEVYQTMNRGARIAGQDCDYIRQRGSVDNKMVLVEGCEADLACIWFRALGFTPPSLFAGSPFSKGMVPRALPAVVRGPQALRCYKLAAEWPGKTVATAEVEVSSPIELQSESSSPVDESFTPGDVRSRSPSVWTIETGESVHMDVGTASGVVATYGGSGQEPVPPSRANAKSYHRPSPRGGGGSKAISDSLARLDAFAGLTVSEHIAMEVGTYYGLRGYGVVNTTYFADGLNGIVNSANARGYSAFFDGLRPDMRAEAFTRAMLEYNVAVVRHNAAISLVAKVSDRHTDFDIVHEEAFKQWIAMIRDVLVSADTIANSAIKILKFAGKGNVQVADSAYYRDKEVELVAFLIRLLNSCVNGGEVVKGIGDANQFQDLYGAAEPYPQLVARWRVKVAGGGIRQKIANVVLGDRPVVIDAVSVVD